MRMHSVISTIENGFVHLPEKASWLGEYLHELMIFPHGKYDDQVDSTSQFLDWFKQHSKTHSIPEFWRREVESMKTSPRVAFNQLSMTRETLHQLDRLGMSHRGA